MNYPLVSVLIPTYNVEQFVEDAIKSIMEQTYQNLEIIIVDDASNDNTYPILSGLALRDKRIKLYRNDSNRKIVETLNFAFSKSNGEYIARMDGDDISLPDRILKQFSYLNENSDISLVGVNATIIDERGEVIHNEDVLTDFNKIKKALFYASPILHNWLAKREVYESIGPYRIPTVEDYDFILRTIDFGFRVNNVPESLYLVRIRTGNTATSSGLIQRKSFRFAKKLHYERTRNKSNKDSYTLDRLASWVKSGRVENWFFRQSTFFHYKYIKIKEKSAFKACLYRLLSLVFSPFEQTHDIYKRWRYKKIKN